MQPLPAQQRHLLMKRLRGRPQTRQNRRHASRQTHMSDPNVRLLTKPKRLHVKRRMLNTTQRMPRLRANYRYRKEPSSILTKAC